MNPHIFLVKTITVPSPARGRCGEDITEGGPGLLMPCRLYPSCAWGRGSKPRASPRRRGPGEGLSGRQLVAPLWQNGEVERAGRVWCGGVGFGAGDKGISGGPRGGLTTFSCPRLRTWGVRPSAGLPYRSVS